MFKIILPQTIYIASNAHRRMASHTKCLWHLNSREDVTVCEDDVYYPPKRPGLVSNNNGKCGCFFSVNGHLFCVFDTDRPGHNVEDWLEYYSKHVKAFFICNYYKDLKEIFEKSNVKVFPFFGSGNVALPFLNNDEITKNMPDRSIKKDIPIFFRGKFQNNEQRASLAQMANKAFPGSCIKNSGQSSVDEETYLNILQRSKIVWSPPSVVTIPNKYSICVRAKEAMCVETLLVRQPIDVFTPEELIPNEHFVETNRDHSNLIELLEHYLYNEEERFRIARNGRLFFERNFTDMARATYLLEKCISVIEEE